MRCAYDRLIWKQIDSSNFIGRMSIRGATLVESGRWKLDAICDDRCDGLSRSDGRQIKITINC